MCVGYCVCVCRTPWLVQGLGMGFKSPFLLPARHQVRYLLEWTEEDLDEAEDAAGVADLEFCHPLCQCPKCAPAQKVWRLFFWKVGVGVDSTFFFSP